MQKDLIRRTQFEHIVPFAVLNAVMQKVKEIEKFYGEHLTEERIVADFEERLYKSPDETSFDMYIELAAVCIVAAKLKKPE